MALLCEPIAQRAKKVNHEMPLERFLRIISAKNARAASLRQTRFTSTAEKPRQLATKSTRENCRYYWRLSGLDLGWGGRIRTSEWRNQNLPEGFAFEHHPLHLEEDGATVFREACKLGCEGVVSKRLALPLWTFAPLGEGEEPQSASGETRGREELGPLIISQAQFG
jgi:hypothetical protein